MDGLEFLAHVCGHQKTHGVHAVLRRLRLLKGDGKADLLHIQLPQLP